jgi:heat shock protein HslJ
MKRLALLCLMLGLIACAGKIEMNDVIGNWQLVSMDGQPSPKTMREGNITLEIQADGKFAGQAPVNRYFGQIKHADKTLGTGPVGSTMMAGPPELMQAEAAFFKVLNDVQTVNIENAQLHVTGTNGKVLVFDRAE